MRIMLTGCNGQAGFELSRTLAPLGDVIALDRAGCDLANEAGLRAAVRQIRPDVIVNAAAYTAVDKAETDEALAHAVNAAAPGILGEEAARCGALVIHYSTDYVFDGSGSAPFHETSATGPLNAYGRSKLAGEQALAASGARHFIFRTSWVYGVHGSNFARTMLRLAAEREELRIVADQTGAPTAAALIADVTAHALRQAAADSGVPSGVYHLAASGETTWFDYAAFVIAAARKAGHSLRLPEGALVPIATADYPLPAARPLNSRLGTGRLRQTFGLVLPHWQHGMDHFLKQVL
jgi:dTDP-4-dehydrorhamnose reductase